MVDYEYGALFNDDSIKKEIIIKYGNTTITNEDLFNQELELDESLCSEEQLAFGSCEASVIKFRVANIVSPVKGNWISVGMAIDGHTDNPLAFGRYKVESDKPTSDRKWREIVAYDALYDMINDDVSDWYKSVLPNKNVSMTLSQFRKLFLQRYGVQEEIGAPLVNDSMVVTRSIDPDELSGAKVITAICELNGCFGHIDRNGKFKSVNLVQGIKGLYPKNDLYPADDIYPRDPKSTPIGKGIYITCDYEDFTVSSITGVDIYKEENAFGGSFGIPDNKYVVEDNFLVYGKSEQEISAIANNLLSAIRGLDYRPFDAECKGNPCFEVGDPVRFSTKYAIVESYILNRTLKGTQALKDSYNAKGTEKYEIKVNSARRETAQLSGKTEQLERVSGEQQENIENINSGIDVINEEIGEVNANIGQLHVSLKKTDEGLSAEVSRAKSAEETLSSRINMTDSNILIEVQRAQNAENSLSGRINVEAGNIAIEVERAKSAEATLSSRISVAEGNINLKVSKGEVISAINLSPEAVDIDANKINLNGAITANGNFKVNLDGTISSTGGTFTNAYFEDTIYLLKYGNVYPVMSVPSAGYLNIGNSYTHTTILGSGQCNGIFQVDSISGRSGSLSFLTNPTFSDIGSSGSEANVYIGSYNRLNRVTSSSKRYKNHVKAVVNEDLDPHKVYDIPVVQFRFNKDHLSNMFDSRYDRDVIGIMAEDVEKYYPIAADYKDGVVENWNARYLIPPILSLTQEHKSKLDEHDDLINKIIKKIGGI